MNFGMNFNLFFSPKKMIYSHHAWGMGVKSPFLTIYQMEEKGDRLLFTAFYSFYGSKRGNFPFLVPQEVM